MPELSEVGLRKMEEERKAMRAAAEMTEDARDLEIPRLMSQLEFASDRLAENVHRMLVRTEPVSNMDCAIPDESPNKVPTEQAGTSLGEALQSMIYSLNELSDQINVRNYQLEI